MADLHSALPSGPPAPHELLTPASIPVPIVEAAIKEKAEKEKLEKEKTEKEKAEREKADSEKVDKEKCEREMTVKEKDPMEKPEHEKDPKEKLDLGKDTKEKDLKAKAEHENDLKAKPEHETEPKDKAEESKAEIDPDRARKERSVKDEAAAGGDVKAPAAPVNPPIKPVQKSFTTPAGQTVNVIEPHAESTNPADQPQMSSSPAPPTVIVTEVKKADPAPAATITPEVKKVVEEKKVDPAPAAAATSEVKKVVEEKKSEPAPAAAITTEVKTVEENKADPAPAVVEIVEEKVGEKKTDLVLAAPACIVKNTDFAPAPTIITEKKIEEKKLDVVTKPTVIMDKSDAVTVHELPISDKPAPPELRKVKTESQLATPAANPTLTKDIGLSKDHIAQTDRKLIWKERFASTSREDFMIIDECGKHIFEISKRLFSRTKYLTNAFGKPVLAMRKTGWSRLRNSWDVSTPGRKQVMTIHDGNRMYFHNVFDNCGTDLRLSGAYWRPGGATLHLGTSETGPTVARIESDTVSSEKVLLIAPGLALHQYTLTVVKGFDVALACAAVVALDGERWRDAKVRKKFGWGFVL